MKGKPIEAGCEPASAPLQCQTNPPHRILVVEDNILLRERNAKMLSRSGYAVDAAEDAAAAWETLSADSYDLLIINNSMPKVGGVELLKKLRAARMALPVIMAAGTLPTQEFATSPWLQPDATLLKPYSGKEMLRTVKKVLREADNAAEGSPGFMCHDKKDNKTPQAGEPAGAPSAGLRNSPHRILAVDEDSDLRLLYVDALARPGYYVEVAEDGAAGWEALQASRYDVLITENDMPKLTGVELVKKLRAARMALPVVMAAGRLPTAELARNPSLQLAATLVKPFAVEALLNTVRTVLRATDPAREPSEPMPDWRSQPSADALQL